MRLLILAPQPFYQERGTPIAVDLLLKVLSSQNYSIDLLTYPEGTTRNYPGVTHHRIWNNPLTQGIKPGFGLKKLINDFFMLLHVLILVCRNRYDMIHAVEESAYIALICKLVFRIPYVYDMDSSLAEQMVEKMPGLRHLLPLFQFAEGTVIKASKGVLPVCDSLAGIASKFHQKPITLLNDISLLDQNVPGPNITPLRKIFSISTPLALYIGNLEKYQGIDLLLESFERLIRQNVQISLVIIGGNDADISKYTAISQKRNLSSRVFFAGPKPVEDMKAYMDQADILISPRTLGKNTPMKVYSYLHSGKPVLATRIESHTQVMNDENSVLVSPDPEAMAKGILSLLENPDLGKSLAQKAIELIESRYSYSSYRNKLLSFYQSLK